MSIKQISQLFTVLQLDAWVINFFQSIFYTAFLKTLAKNCNFIDFLYIFALLYKESFERLLVRFGDFLNFGENKALFQCKFYLHHVSLVFEFFDSLFLDFFVPVLVVSNPFKKFHQIYMLSYLLDSGLVDGFLHAYFPVDLLNHIFDFLRRVRLNGLFVNHSFQICHYDLHINSWRLCLDCFKRAKAGILEQIHLFKLVSKG